MCLLLERIESWLPLLRTLLPQRMSQRLCWLSQHYFKWHDFEWHQVPDRRKLLDYHRWINQKIIHRQDWQINLVGYEKVLEDQLDNRRMVVTRMIECLFRIIKLPEKTQSSIISGYFNSSLFVNYKFIFYYEQ